MSRASRRQTRSRRFNLHWTQWPIHHNAQVALDKEEKRILRGDYTAPNRRKPHHQAPPVIFVITTTASPDCWLEKRRTEIAHDYHPLDTLAGLGWDVRDEMNALAAEEADLMKGRHSVTIATNLIAAECPSASSLTSPNDGATDRRAAFSQDRPLVSP